MYMYISNTTAVISTHEDLSGGGESKKDCHSDGVHVPACVPDSKVLLFCLSKSDPVGRNRGGGGDNRKEGERGGEKGGKV